MLRMNIVADENIPLVSELFADVGDVTCLPGRSIGRSELVEADILLVRSVTKVDESLLSGTAVRFVGTCTIGTDHLDLDYLQLRNIGWSNAPGSNANSVVEYVFSVLATLKSDWLQSRVGIVGAGNVGGLLYRRLAELGVSCLVYDPFLDPQQQPDLSTLEQVCQADVLCLHTPLTASGDYPTHHLLNEDLLKKLSPSALLINAGRGPVVDNTALSRVLRNRKDLKVALDVWETEPDLNLQLLQQVQLGSPHIAGYSHDGKLAGTVMVFHAVCEHLGLTPAMTLEDAIARFAQNGNVITPACADVPALINECILGAYNVAEDDLSLRKLLTMSEADQKGYFDNLRRHYRRRREFSACEIRLPGEYSQRQYAMKMLNILGFNVTEDSQ